MERIQRFHGRGGHESQGLFRSSGSDYLGPGPERHRSLDHRDDFNLYVLPDGNPVFAGVHHVELRDQIAEAAGVATDIHVNLRRWLRPVLLHSVSGNRR